MKIKKNKIITVIIALVLLIALIPHPIHYRDGGSVEYKALTYSVIHYRRLYDTPQREGWEIRIFGFEVYNDWDEPMTAKSH